MTPTLCCGFECGVSGTTAHFAIAFTASFETASPITGARSARCNPTAGQGTMVSGSSPTNIAFAATTGIKVWRVNVKFDSLPTTDSTITYDNSTKAGAMFKASDGKIYAGFLATTFGATGVAVTTGVTYTIDVRVDSSANPHLIDVSVDGAACGQLSRATAADTNATQVVVGFGIGTITANAVFDDVVCSQTSGDFPIGAGYVNHFVPTSDGTHNVAGAADFRKTLTATDILNATTDAWQLVDDVPLDSGASVDWINMLAPPNATDYVECVFGPASGISTPTTAPRAVEVIAAYHQAATGAGNMEIRMNDNGTTNAMYTATGVAGVTSVAYARKHYATAIAGGGAWVIGGGGNGDFTDLRVRFGSPAALDVNPDQYFDCIMVEAEFAAVVVGDTQEWRGCFPSARSALNLNISY